jgi:hypothetical protein
VAKVVENLFLVSVQRRSSQLFIETGYLRKCNSSIFLLVKEYLIRQNYLYSFSIHEKFHFFINYGSKVSRIFDKIFLSQLFFGFFFIFFHFYFLLLWLFFLLNFELTNSEDFKFILDVSFFTVMNHCQINKMV